MIIIKIFYSIIFVAVGFFLIKYRRTVKSWTGTFFWAEKYLGSGGTYLVIILLGLFLMFYGVIYPFGGMEMLMGGGEKASLGFPK